MPMSKPQMEEIKTHISMARKRDLGFGLCLGKKPDGTLLICHKTKDPTALGRQAKKEGETNKIAFGTMACEGKVLNLTCQGDVPSGLGRKVKLLMKSAGLSLKVMVLDADGGTLEADEEDEEEQQQQAVTQSAPPQPEEEEQQQAAAEDGNDQQDDAGNEDDQQVEAVAQEDPQKKNWDMTAQKLEPHISDILDKKLGNHAKVDAVWKMAMGKVNQDTPDYVAALKLAKMAAKLVAEARAAPVKSEPAMAGEGGETQPGPPAGGSGAPVDAGDGTPEPPAADAAGDDTAPPPAPEAEETPAAAGDVPPVATPPADLTGDKDAKIARADERLKKIDGLIKAYGDVMTSLGEPTPAEWTKEVKRITDALKPMRAPDAAEDKAALDKLLTDIVALETTVQAETAKKKTFEQAYDLFEIHLETLDNHPQSAKAPEVKPHIDAIKADRDKALAKAKTHDFKGAQAALPALTKKCEEVEKLADEYSHYAAILTQRQGAVAKSAGPATGTADVDNLQTKMETLLRDAQADAAAGKFGDGVKKLDQIPDLAREMLLLGKAAKDYNWYVNNCDNRIAAVEAKPEADRKPYKDSIAKFKALVTAGKYPATKDYYISQQKLWKLESHLDFIEKGVAATATYNTRVNAFKTQLAAYKSHAGKDGITAFIQRMEGDLLAAEAEAGKLKHATAESILKQYAAADFTAQTQKAVEYAAYKTKRDAVAQKIEDQRKRPAAEPLLAQADALMATAGRQAVALDFVKALASATEAEKRCNAAKDAADAADALGKLKDTGKLDKLSEDLAAALKVFTDMKAHVAGLDTGNDLKPLLDLADKPAADAEAAAKKSPPDFATARTKLDEAIAMVEDAQAKLSAMQSFKADLAAVTTKIRTTLPAADPDGCLTKHLAKAEAALALAVPMTIPPVFDFAKGGVQVLEAERIADEAAANLAFWTDIKTNKAAISTEIGNFPGNAAVMAAMPKRLARLNKYVADIDAAMDKADFKEADRLAKAGAAVALATVQDRANCDNAIKRKGWWYDDKLTALGTPVPDPAKKHLAEANVHLAKYQKAMADESFGTGGALNLINSVGLAMDAALAAVAASAAYLPIQTAAAAAIKKITDIPHDGVADELKDLQDRYAAAEKFAKDGNFARATAEMTKITVECPAVEAKAKEHKAYMDARTESGTKLQTALKHEHANAIRPMLVRLAEKRKRAEALAGKGNYVDAKRLMDEISDGADEAIGSADRAEIVDDVSDQIKDWTSDDGPNVAVLKMGQALYLGLTVMSEAPKARAQLDLAKEKLDAASKGGAGAADAMKAAMEACDEADSVMRQYSFLMQSVDHAKAQIALLKSHPQKAFIATKLAAIEEGVKAVEASEAVAGTFDPAVADIEKLIGELNNLKEIADKYAEYVALRASEYCEARLEKLEKHKHRYAIKANIDTIRAKLSEAESKVSEFDIDPALKLLEEVKALGISSIVLADMRENKAPKVDDIKAILARPDGAQELDAMVDGLEPGARRTVLRVAFEARFGCKLQNFVDTAQTTVNPDGTKTGPDIERFYEVMSALPLSDTLENDSMVLFTNLEGPAVSPAPGVGDPNAGSRYNSTKKEVIMHEGREHLSPAYRFGVEHEVGGGIEADCQPSNKDEVDFFSWNTLHEVGHAVDDKHGFMNKFGKGTDYGGWKVHGGDFTEVAEAIAKEFKYDKVYVLDRMSGRANPAIPEPPTGCSVEEWETRRLRALDFLNVAASSSKPWRSDTAMQKLKLGERIYLESYAGFWHSYEAKARSKAMTGYQFRAPGEWFSELYAAFHSGKMKNSHPSHKWLSDL